MNTKHHNACRLRETAFESWMNNERTATIVRRASATESNLWLVRLDASKREVVLRGCDVSEFFNR